MGRVQNNFKIVNEYVIIGGGVYLNWQIVLKYTFFEVFPCDISEAKWEKCLFFIPFHDRRCFGDFPVA